jgi:hypothetical protein
MSTRGGTKLLLRCYHCGREVAETVHTRTAYKVDFYALYTGETEPIAVPDPEDAERAMTVLRLVRSIFIVSCSDCYRQPAVRWERELLLRPELAPGRSPLPGGGPPYAGSGSEEHARRQ